MNINITEIALMTDTEVMSYLSRSVKEIRIRQNLKQTDLASRSGVPLGTVRAVERSGKISLSNFIKILRVLDKLDILIELGNTPVITNLEEYAKGSKVRQRVKK
jgi:transcriptional regulator with XRE-family HTH domain